MQVLLNPVRKWLREGAREPLDLTEFTRVKRCLHEHLKVALSALTHATLACLLTRHVLYRSRPPCLLPPQP